MYHTLCTAYGWTIDYINENITIPQIFLLLKEITGHPPIALLGFAFGENNEQGDSKLLKQIDGLGIEKVEAVKHLNNPKIKEIVRLKDKKKLK